MKTALCITTINAPTTGLKKAIYEITEGTKNPAFIVGDSITPKETFVDLGENTTYIHPGSDLDILKTLPVKSYARKNVGYAQAILAGCEQIIETDDDNIPYDNWLSNMEREIVNVREIISSKSIGYNPYAEFTDENVWPRGLNINDLKSTTSSEYTQNNNVACLQGLADKSPDVDAIWRLNNDGNIYFRKRPPFSVAQKNLLPTNSQNTLWKKVAFPLLYIPHTVEMRFCDILRGYVASRILNLNGYSVAFCQASVYQERNYHDIYQDFLGELTMYKLTPELLGLLLSFDGTGSVSDDLRAVYSKLVASSICRPEELDSLSEWLHYVSK